MILNNESTGSYGNPISRTDDRILDAEAWSRAWLHANNDFAEGESARRALTVHDEALRAALATAEAEVVELRHRLYPDQGHGYANEVERQRGVIEELTHIAESYKADLATAEAERDDAREALVMRPSYNVLVERVGALEAALPKVPWGENDECYSCGSGEGDPHFDECAWVAARALLGDAGVPDTPPQNAPPVESETQGGAFAPRHRSDEGDMDSVSGSTVAGGVSDTEKMDVPRDQSASASADAPYGGGGETHRDLSTPACCPSCGSDDPKVRGDECAVSITRRTFPDAWHAGVPDTPREEL